tara:strand:- start:517 stop:678 length:162 start_codon:yes stop_codon:yes gene_type:complete
VSGVATTPVEQTFVANSGGTISVLPGDAPNLEKKYNANPHSSVFEDSYYRNIR